MFDRKVFVYSKPYEGQLLPDYIGTPDCIAFDIDDTGAYLRVSYRGVTPQEMRDFQSKNKKVGVAVVQNFLVFVFKIGTQEWMDAPYTPHLSLRLHKLNDERAMRDLLSSINIVLIDTLDGIIKSLTSNRLPEPFVVHLYERIQASYATSFDQEEHNAMVDMMQRTISTGDLAMYATITECID